MRVEGGKFQLSIDDCFEHCFASFWCDNTFNVSCVSERLMIVTFGFFVLCGGASQPHIRNTASVWSDSVSVMESLGVLGYQREENVHPIPTGIPRKIFRLPQNIKQRRGVSTMLLLSKCSTAT